MDCKLTSAIENLKSELRYENEKLADSFIARFESANAAIREEFNAKISSEIRAISDQIGNVSRDAENKITTLNSTIKSVPECMKGRMNTHVAQPRKYTVGRDKKLQQLRVQC